MLLVERLPRIPPAILWPPSQITIASEKQTPPSWPQLYQTLSRCLTFGKEDADLS